MRNLMSPADDHRTGHDTDVELRRRRQVATRTSPGSGSVVGGRWRGGTGTWRVVNPCSRGCLGLNRRPPGRELQFHDGCPSLLTARRRIARGRAQLRMRATPARPPGWGPRMRSAADDARHATIDAGRCHRRSPQRESRTNEIRRAVAPRLSRSEGPEKPGLRLGAIRATGARHDRSARREHMKHGDPPD